MPELGLHLAQTSVMHLSMVCLSRKLPADETLGHQCLHPKGALIIHNKLNPMSRKERAGLQLSLEAVRALPGVECGG